MSKDSGNSRQVGWGTVAFWSLALSAISGFGALEGKAIYYSSKFEGMQQEVNAENERADKAEAELQQARQQAASNLVAAQTLPGLQTSANACQAKLSVYESNNPILERLQDVQKDKDSLDENITLGTISAGGMWEKADDVAIAEMHTRSTQYQEQIISLQSRIECTHK